MGALLLAGVLIHGTLTSIEAITGIAFRLSWDLGWPGLLGWVVYCIALGGMLGFIGPFIAEQAKLDEAFPFLARIEARLVRWIPWRKIRRSDEWWDYDPEKFP